MNQGTTRRASRPESAQSRLFAPDSPAVLGSLQGGLNSRERTQDRSCRPEPSVGSALHRPRTQETVESLRVGPGGPSAAWMPRPSLQGCICIVSCPDPPAGSTRYPEGALHSQLELNKTRPKPGFLHDQTTIRNQSPCCFCRCSQRSWASMVRSAVRRASRRSRPISSPVSTQ